MMIRKGKIGVVSTLFVEALLLIPLLITCERFEPESELYFYTDTITSISRDSYTFRGAVVNIGDDEVTHHGFCWSDSKNPTLDRDTLLDLGPLITAEKFSAIVTGLKAGSTYYVKSFVISDEEIEYGNELAFNTPAPTKPVVTTTSVSEITQTSSLSGGTIDDDGGSTILTSGICWDSLDNPNISKRHTTTEGSRISFTESLSGLSCGRVYYLRAYASNAVGIGYGDVISFETSNCPIGLPTVTTSAISSVSETSAQCGGNVTDEGGGTVTAKGVCWSNSPGPTISDGFTTDGSGGGSFTSTITGLTNTTTYYVRAYATNSLGTIYGEQVEFKTNQNAIVAPTVTTAAISSFTESTAQCGGDVTNEGGGTVTVKGVCWGTSSMPTITDMVTVNGSGIGSYTSAISGLSCNTTYYVRAYATNSVGTSYGSEVYFTSSTCPVANPVVTTAAISNVMENSAVCGGNVTSEGGGTVTEKGVCWSTSQLPTIGDSKKTEGGGLGGFTSSIAGLTCNTIYYVRAYATNSASTSYGSQVEFKTELCTSVTDINGNRYEAVKIGTQVWMAENLRVTRYANASGLQLVTDSVDWINLESNVKAYCWYNNDPINGETYGAIYSWAGAMNESNSSGSNPSGVQGVCPNGWHLPSDAEWKQLEIYLGMDQAEADLIYWRGSNQGTKLKESGTTHWVSPNLGTNSSKFTALPSGLRHYNGSFLGNGHQTFFWTATEDNATDAWDRHLYFEEEGVHRKSNSKIHGLSVRCVMDD